MGIYTTAFLKAFKPKPILTISEWADKNRFLTTGESNRPGRWRTSATPYLKEPMDVCGQRDHKHVVLMFGSQLGKALHVDTPVATVDGWKTQGTLQVGDFVFGMDGKKTKVVALSDVWVNRPCYEINFSDGSKIIADENHEWYVESAPYNKLETKYLRLCDHVGRGFYIKNLERVTSVPVRCIQVDSSDHLYLVGRNMIPTHNSELINNVSAFYIDQEPAPQMIVQPTLDAAEDYSKIRIGPMIKACPALSDKVNDTEANASRRRGKKASSTTLFKPFTGGYVVLSGANSASSLASKPIRVLLRDEIDRFTDSIPGEGSPLDLSEQRTRTFYNKKIVDSSTPLVKGESKIEALFLQSDQRRYYLPCPHCGGQNELMWDMVEWDKDGTDLERSKTARIICNHCKESMRGAGRINNEWLARGVWKKTAKSDIAGFYINSLCSPFTELSELVLIYLKAWHEKDEDKKQTFYNLILGIPYDKSIKQTIDYKEMYKNRREYYASEVPNNVLMLTCGVDTQDTYLAAEIKGWSYGYESWGIEYRIFMGKPDNPQVWSELDAWLLKKRTRTDGTELPVMSTLVDSGGHYTKEVYAFTKAREGRRVFSIKGHSRENSPYISKPSKVGTMNAHLFNLHVDSGKTKIMQRIQLQEHGSGYMHFPRSGEHGYDEEYFRGLLSEKYVLKRVGGHLKGSFVKTYERNEPLDVFNYAQAAAELVSPDFEMLEKMIENQKNMAVKPPQPRRTNGVISKGIEI